MTSRPSRPHPQPMMRVERLAVHYAGAPACRDVGFSVSPGECLTLIGANGAGKSTVVSALAGTVRTRGGSVHLDGEDVSQARPHVRVRRGLATVPETRHLFPFMTVAETLRVPMPYARTGSWNPDRVFDMFPALARRSASLAGNLSGGERQMLALGRALVLNPRMLILDEPSAGLAPAVVQELGSVIKGLVDTGMTLLLVEQNIQVARMVADRVAVMAFGEIRLTGTAEILSDDEGLLEAYLGAADPRAGETA